MSDPTNIAEAAEPPVLKLDKAEVIERFCRLSGRVRDQLNGAADCFCGGNAIAVAEQEAFGIFEYDKAVIVFIEQAVRVALEGVRA